MKKFLVLALVLGIAGLVNAGIQITTTDEDGTLLPSETAWVTVTSDTPLLGGWFGFVAIIIGGDGEFTGSFVEGTMPQGPTHEVTYYGDLRPDFPFDAWYADLTVPSITPNPAGDYISFEVHCIGPAPMVVVVTDGDGVILDELTFIQPEPMTMLLLGLGGLFLRKR